MKKIIICIVLCCIGMFGILFLRNVQQPIIIRNQPNLSTSNITMAEEENMVTNDKEEATKLVIYSENGLFGLNTNKGELILPATYEEIELNEDESIGLLRQGDKWGFATISGTIINPTYDNMGQFCQNIAIIYSNDKYGLIDINGDNITLLKYDNIERDNVGKYIVSMNINSQRQYGLIDWDGTLICDTVYDYISYEYEQKRKIGKNKKFGVINVNGEEIIEPLYSGMSDFHEGLLAVEKNGKWGFIDDSNNIIIPFQYDAVTDFYFGCTAVFPMYLLLWTEQGKLDKNNIMNNGNKYLLFNYLIIDKSGKELYSCGDVYKLNNRYAASIISSLTSIVRKNDGWPIFDFSTYPLSRMNLKGLSSYSTSEGWIDYEEDTLIDVIDLADNYQLNNIPIQSILKI